MDQPTATLIAGIVAACGSTAIGVTAVLTSWRSSREALRQQERLLVADKLWERRADVYVELFAAIRTVESRTPDPHDGRTRELADLLSPELLARLRAYDPGPVQTALNAHLSSPDGRTFSSLERVLRESMDHPSSVTAAGWREAKGKGRRESHR